VFQIFERLVTESIEFFFIVSGTEKERPSLLLPERKKKKMLAGVVEQTRLRESMRGPYPIS
jgi:hypothetical protein